MLARTIDEMRVPVTTTRRCIPRGKALVDENHTDATKAVQGAGRYSLSVVRCCFGSSIVVLRQEGLFLGRPGGGTVTVAHEIGSLVFEGVHEGYGEGFEWLEGSYSAL